jgi:hypothetical protein
MSFNAESWGGGLKSADCWRGRDTVLFFFICFSPISVETRQKGRILWGSLQHFERANTGELIFDLRAACALKGGSVCSRAASREVDPSSDEKSNTHVVQWPRSVDGWSLFARVSLFCFKVDIYKGAYYGWEKNWILAFLGFIRKHSSVDKNRAIFFKLH